jgi:hypothetical protein
MRLPIAHHLLRYHPSESLDVCQHIRLRFPQGSGLASDVLLEALKERGAVLSFFWRKEKTMLNVGIRVAELVRWRIN